MPPKRLSFEKPIAELEEVLARLEADGNEEAARRRNCKERDMPFRLECGPGAA